MDMSSNIVPLRGNNYPTWKIQVKMALIKDNLWNIVNESESAPISADNLNKFLARKDRALATIVLNIDPSLLYIIGDPTDPTIVWKKLADQFQKKSWANKLNLRRRLFQLRLDEGCSVNSHIKTMTEIFQELAVMGDNINDEEKVIYLLASLPESFEMLVTALQSHSEVPRWEVVIERLLYEESKNKEREGKKNNEMNALASTHTKRGHSIRCGFRGKNAHTQRHCYSRKKLFKRDSCNISHENDDVIGLIASNALVTNERTNWIVDSGASCHMCTNYEKFIDYEKFDVVQNITLGDGYCVEAIGKGTIELLVNSFQNRRQKCKLYETLHVPKLTFNLMSVSRATKQGKKFIFFRVVL